MSTSPPPKTTSPTPAQGFPATGTTEDATGSPANTTATPPTTAPPAQTAPVSSDPKVAELQLMFPSVDVGVIEMILESVGNSQDRAIEQLLSMTDPDFQPDERHARTEEESQLDLDAQFARSLAMQDEQNMMRRQERQQGQLPYQPRVRRARPVNTPGQEVATQQERDAAWSASAGPGMIAMEDKLNHFAEAGKQTFSTLFSRAKAKYNEFQTQQAAHHAQQNVNGQQQSHWGGAGPSVTPPTGTPTPGGGRGGEQNRRGLWGDDASSLSSQSTIDPGPTPLSPHSASNPPPRQTQRWQPSDAYDDSTPQGSTINVNKREIIKRDGATSPEKQTGKIDMAKLGILPKKRVDLMSTSPPVTTTPKAKTAGAAQESDDEYDPNPTIPSAHKSLVEQIPKTPPAKKDNPYTLGDSDDELEYTKNPFDEK